MSNHLGCFLPMRCVYVQQHSLHCVLLKDFPPQMMAHSMHLAVLNMIMANAAPYLQTLRVSTLYAGLVAAAPCGVPPPSYGFATHRRVGATTKGCSKPQGMMVCA